VLPNRAAGKKVIAFFENFAEGRKIKRIKDFQPGGELPGKKKEQNADEAEPVGNQLTRTLPGAVRRQRVRLIDGDEIDGVWF
jgi:hypothetical protein